MSIGSFLLGLVLMAIGFFMVARTNWFVENFGDLGVMFGVPDKNWVSWKMLGIGFLVFGFLIGFGLLQLFLAATVGRLFLFGGFGGV